MNEETAVRRIATVHELEEALERHRWAGDRVALVPTMGALHEGHLGLVKLAAAHADVTVVSIYVNAAQFDRADDLAAYPRDVAGDLASLAGLGDAAPAFVFVPDTHDVDPRPPLTTVHVASLTDRLCGAGRPGHFDAVATVVLKFLHLVRPDVAVFGRKDFQQLAMIRRLVSDLRVPVEIVGGPTARERDGLALSSRNRRLRAQDRVAARAIPMALAVAVEAARRTAGTAGFDLRAIEQAALSVLGDRSDVEVEYLEVVDPETLHPPEPAEAAEQLLVAVAAHVGPVRLIDNVVVGDRDDERRLLAAVGHAQQRAGHR